MITPEICSLILGETNKKASEILSSGKSKKEHIPFTEDEFDGFLGLLIFAGGHHYNREHVFELLKLQHLPLFRAMMSCSRFCELLRFIRVDDGSTRVERLTEQTRWQRSEQYGTF